MIEMIPECDPFERGVAHDPELFNCHADDKSNGEPTHLVSAVLSGGKTWCLVQPIAP